MVQPEYTFLLIDDQKSEMDGFINAGKQRKILIHAVDNVEDGLVKLKADPDRYQAVILDAKCKFRKADLAESYNEAALRAAIKALDEMGKVSGRLLPRCIYTGYSEAAANNELTEQVFMKGGRGTEAGLFDYLCGEVNMSASRAIERDHAATLALCNDEYLPKAKQAPLLELLLKTSSTNPAEIEQFIQSARKFVEDMYKRMNQVDNTWLPDVLFNRGNPNLTWCSLYMSGVKEIKDSRTQQVICQGLQGVPKHICHSIRFLTDATNTISHTGIYQPSQHALKSVAFALLEVLHWYKNELDLRITP
ncbi:MAG: hypothetical protein ACOH13_13120 [Flavobacteriales bacterium]